MPKFSTGSKRDKIPDAMKSPIKQQSPQQGYHNHNCPNCSKVEVLEKKIEFLMAKL